VIEQDTLLFRIDRAGRLSDAAGKPVAVLVTDGNLVAEDDSLVGWIGAGSSFLADRKTPSVRLLPSGDASFTLSQGAWQSAGRWEYCQGAMLRTCTLVMHVIAARDRQLIASGKTRSGASLGNVLQLLELLKLAQ
jgi:hypothetical protein